MRKILLTALLAATLGAPVSSAAPAHVHEAPAPSYTLDSISLGEIKPTKKLNRQLRHIADMKSFGVDTLGLEPGPNYTRYKEGYDIDALYRLFVSPKGAIAEDTDTWISLWRETEYRTKYNRPFVLTSHLDDLLDEEEFYREKGYDVSWEETFDYYTEKGCDVTPFLLQETLVEQVYTVLHEDWHYTLESWHPAEHVDLKVHEASAEVIGYAGAMEYMKARYGKDSFRYRNARRTFRNLKKNAAEVNEAFRLLDVVYASDLPDDKKMLQKEKILEKYNMNGWDFNNAALLGYRPYSKHIPVMMDVYEKAGSVKAFVDLMRDCPVEEETAITYLQDYVEGKSEKE
ncbi:MAG: hypothetical protein V1729_05255 [Candidatus Woesearchaeota archaeon]